MIRVGVLTVSDLGFRGEREDTAGQAVRERIEAMGWNVTRYGIVPDEKDIISFRLREWSDEERLQLILTTGGTGCSRRDVTPEATREVLDRQTPGISEAMRAAGLRKTPLAMVSRGVSGIRRGTLIVNLPGSKNGAMESLDAVAEALPHALDVIAGRPGH
jgi:molybdopterin adenylyltransferase